MSASWFDAEASDGILLFIPLIAVSIVDILSYTAFFDGAIHVTPSQLDQYAVSLTAPLVAALTWSSTYFLVAGSQL